MRPPRQMRLRNAFEDTSGGDGFLFELGEQCVDDLHASSSSAAASAALRTRACSAVHPAATFGRRSSGNGPASVCVNLISVPSGVSIRRYITFDVAAVDMKSGPQ